MATTAVFRIWRGEGASAKFVDYKTEVEDGMVVLDVVHRIQATQANDLAVRWNCKAGKCGSCSAEVNGQHAVLDFSGVVHKLAGFTVSAPDSERCVRHHFIS